MRPANRRRPAPRPAREVWARCLAYAIYLVLGAAAAAALIALSDTWAVPHTH